MRYLTVTRHRIKVPSVCTSLAISLLVGFSQSAWAYEAVVEAVLDGDTIRVLHDGRPEVVRLNGIDCPEKGQPFRQEAKAFTNEKCFGKKVSIEGDKRDRYDRTLGDVFLPDRTLLNAELVRSGLAWWYEYFDPNNINLKNLQNDAREHKRGLWADSAPVSPWEFRKQKRLMKARSSNYSNEAVADDLSDVNLELRSMTEVGLAPDTMLSASSSGGTRVSGTALTGGIEQGSLALQSSSSASVRGPLEGNVEQRALKQDVALASQSPQAGAGSSPLMGNVEQRALKQDVSLLSQSAQSGAAPLVGGVEKSGLPIELQGQNPRLGLAPLSGRVQDSQNKMLSGQVDKSQVEAMPDLNALTPGRSGIMRITQFKTMQNDSTALNPIRGSSDTFRPQVRQTEPGVAPLRPSSDMQRPVRDLSTDSRPMRGWSTTAPRRELANARPLRDEMSAPQREDSTTSGAPVRSLLVDRPPIVTPDRYVDQPPIRIASLPGLAPGYDRYMNQPPRRIPGYSIEQPPLRIDMEGDADKASRKKHRKDKRKSDPSDGVSIDGMQGGDVIPQSAPPRRRRTGDDLSTAPSIQLPALGSRVVAPPETVPLTPTEESLLWDRWYAQLNQQLCEELKRTMPAHANPAGRCIVKIRVSADHKLQASIVNSSSDPFGQAVKEGYLALNGRSVLQFPPRTQRSFVEYQSEHVQETPGPTDAFIQNTIQGDREIIR